MATDHDTGIELSPEELRRALSLRPKVPLTAAQQDGLLEMLEWFEQRKSRIEEARLRREAWQKRYPIIFAGLSSLIGVITLVYNVWVRRP
jgi:hypothetical protein